MTNIKVFENDLPDIDLSKEKSISLDCEALGLVLGRDPLTLIQLGLESKNFYIIKLNRKNYNAPNLVKILSDDKITKIFHYSRADLAHIKYYLKTETNNVLDTKIASRLSRSYSDNHSLKTLIKEFVNIDISKQFQSSDFGGELSPAQLKYCANDVIYLHKIHDELYKILERENRVKLYEDCLKFVKTRVQLDLSEFKDSLEITDILGEKDYSTVERRSIRPCLDVNGIWGGYTEEGSKTVIPSKAYAKISMRLVSNQNWKTISSLFTEHMKKITPKGMQIKINEHHGG